MNKRIKKKHLKALRTCKRISAHRAYTLAKWANKLRYGLEFVQSRNRKVIIPHTIYSSRYAHPCEYSEISHCHENDEILVSSITQPLRGQCRYVVLCDNFQGMGDTFVVIDTWKNVIYEIVLRRKPGMLMEIWRSPVCRGRILGAWREYQVCCDDLNGFNIDESSHESLHNSLHHIIDVAREKLKVNEIIYVVTDPSSKKKCHCKISMHNTGG